MQANDDEENANQVLRSVQSAFALLKTKLGEYLNITETSSSNLLITMDEKLTLAMMMPSNFNLSTVDTLAAAAHQYIVSVAVAEWFTITHKTDASDYASMADVCLKIISEAANSRMRPSRPAENGRLQSEP